MAQCNIASGGYNWGFGPETHIYILFCLYIYIYGVRGVGRLLDRQASKQANIHTDRQTDKTFPNVPLDDIGGLPYILLGRP